MILACSAIDPARDSTNQRFFSESGCQTVTVALRKSNACRSCVSTSAENIIVRACAGEVPGIAGATA